MKKLRSRAFSGVDEVIVVESLRAFCVNPGGLFSFEGVSEFSGDSRESLLM